MTAVFTSMAVEQDFIMSVKEATVEHFLWCFSNVLIIVTEVNNETLYNVPSPVVDPKWCLMNTKHDEVKSTDV